MATATERRERGPASVYDGDTMGHLAARAFRRHGDRVAMIDELGPVTYRELGELIGGVAARLSVLGVGPGDGVAQLAGNTTRAWTVQMAVYCLGARFVGLHERGSRNDQRFMLADSRVGTLVVDDGLHPDADAELTSGIDSITEVATHSQLFESSFIPHMLDVSDVLARSNDMARLAYTGGTTGRPKGVMLPHRSLVMNTLMTMAELPWPREIRFISGAPITHGAGSYIVPVLQAGGTVVMMDRFKADAFVETVDRWQCTAAHMVPTMMYDLLDLIGRRPASLASLEMIRYGASPITVARLEEAIEVLGGHRLVQGYGQTEAPNTLCVLAPSEHHAGSPQLASVGHPFAANEIAILDDDLQPVATGQTGEICVRGQLVMDGYWDRPDETASAFAGGWLHTGDVGRCDERGFVYIIDRKKDMIISGGFNVYPKEIEDVLSRHPAVSSVAVVGAPDARWGETVVAVVVPRTGHSIDPAELIDLVKTEKGSVAAPKRVEVLAALPLTAVGKPDKRRLRELLVNEQL